MSRSRRIVTGWVLWALAVSTLLWGHDEVTAPHGGNPPLHAQETMHAFSDHHNETESQAASITVKASISGRRSMTVMPPETIK